MSDRIPSFHNLPDDGDGPFVCYNCRDGLCDECVGIPCQCPCEWPKPEPVEAWVERAHRAEMPEPELPPGAVRRPDGKVEVKSLADVIPAALAQGGDLGSKILNAAAKAAGNRVADELDRAILGGLSAEPSVTGSTVPPEAFTRENLEAAARSVEPVPVFTPVGGDWSGLAPLFGPVILESNDCVEDGEPVEVRRSWRERLFSWPWRPWCATKTVVPKVPMSGGYIIDGHKLGGGRTRIIMHPKTAAAFRAELERKS